MAKITQPPRARSRSGSGPTPSRRPATAATASPSRRLEIQMDRRFMAMVSNSPRTRPSHDRNEGGRPNVIAHGFPAEAGGGINSVASFPQLADRIVIEHGWAALATQAAASVRARVIAAGRLAARSQRRSDIFERPPDRRAYLIGLNWWRSCIEAMPPTRRFGVVVGAPADEDWVCHPCAFVLNEMSLIRDRSFPASFDTWADPVGARCRCCIVVYAPNSWSCMAATTTGAGLDARAVADGHGAADLRIVQGPDTTSATTYGRSRSCSDGWSGSARRWAAAPSSIPVAQPVRARLTRVWLCRLPSAPRRARRVVPRRCPCRQPSAAGRR